MDTTGPPDPVAESLPLPLLVFGPDRRLRLANAALRAFASAGAEQLRPGTPIAEVARLLAYRGLLGPGDPAALAAAVIRADRTRPTRRLLRLPDGRSIEIFNAPLPDGGFLAVTVDVTALVSAQGDAAAELRRLTEVVSALATGIAAFAPDGRLLLHNPSYPGLIGLPPGLLREGMTLSEIVSLLEARGEFAALPDGALPEALRLVEARAPSRFQRRRPTGEVIESRRSALSDGGLLIEVTDVTARQRAEDEARRRAALLDAILDSLPHGVCVYGPDERVVLVNRAHRQMIGGARVGESLAGMLREQAEKGAFGEGDPAALAAAELALRRGGPLDRIRRRRDGRVFSHRIAPLPDGGHVSVVTDISAVVAAEAEAQRQAARLAAIVEGMPFGVALFDPSRRLAAVNAAGMRLGGLDPERAPLGTPFEEVIARQQAAGEYGAEEAARALSADRGRPLSYRRTRPDGTILDILSLPMPDGGFLVTYQDVTPLVQAEAAEARAADRSRPLAYRRRRPNGEVLDIASLPMPDGGFLVTLNDVTALVRAEAEASAQAALLRAMIDNTEAGVLRFDAEARLVAANAFALRMEGLTEEDVARRITRAEVLRRIAERGGFAGSPGRYEETASLPPSAPRAYRRTAADGRVVDVVARPMPDGGFLVTLNDVTALVRAEEEAKRRAALLQGMIDNAAHGVLLYDRDRRLVAGNARGYAYTGLPPEVLRPGALYPDLLALQVAAGEFPEERRQMLLAVDRSRPHAYRRTTSDGRVLDIESKPMPEGGFVISFADVTRLVRAEEAEKHRAETLRAMLDNISSGVFLYDRDHRLVAVNRNGLALTGLSPEEAAPGTPHAELLALLAARGEFGDEAAAEQRMAARRRGEPARYLRTRPDGTVLDVAVAPMPDGGFIVTLTDVTRLLRAEAEIRRRAAVQSAMLDNLRHGIALFDVDSRLVAANALAAETMGLPPERLTPGRTLADLHRDQLAFGEYPSEEAARAILGERWTGGLMAPDRYVRQRPNGRIIEVTTDRTPDGLFVRTYTDVTEDRSIRADLERARGEAEAALRAKSRFLATMTHELRTPLNAVIGFAELLAQPQPPELVEEFAGHIAQAGRDLLGLIDQILDVARSETGGLPLAEGPVPLAPLLQRVASAMQPAAAAAGLSLLLSLPPELPVARADPQRLAQVLQGLLANAIKFTPAGGRVALSAEEGPEGVAIRIADSGIGIPASALPQLFEPFAQLDSGRARRYAGSGIGLYLARSIAEAMGMGLSLDSREGEGTTATLTIPLERLLPEEGSEA
jgi:PAS domain S-box-containing protein